MKTLFINVHLNTCLQKTEEKEERMKEGKKERNREKEKKKKKKKRKKKRKKREADRHKQTGTPAGYMSSTPKTQGEYPCQSFLRSAFLSVLIPHTLLILGSIFILKLVLKKKYEVLLICRDFTG